MKYTSKLLAVLVMTISMVMSLTACNDNNRTTVVEQAPPADMVGTGYYVGNPGYGQWILDPTGHQVWVFYPQYRMYGPTTLDAVLMAGAVHLYYRSLWSAQNPYGWSSHSYRGYNRQKSTVIYNTVIHNHGGSMANVVKETKTPAYQSRLKDYNTKGLGKPKKIVSTPSLVKKSPGLGSPTKTVKPKMNDRYQKPSTSWLNKSAKKHYDYKPKRHSYFSHSRRRR